MVCEDTVLPEPEMKNHNVNCRSNERNMREPYDDILLLF